MEEKTTETHPRRVPPLELRMRVMTLAVEILSGMTAEELTQFLHIDELRTMLENEIDALGFSSPEDGELLDSFTSEGTTQQVRDILAQCIGVQLIVNWPVDRWRPVHTLVQNREEDEQPQGGTD